MFSGWGLKLAAAGAILLGILLAALQLIGMGKKSERNRIEAESGKKQVKILKRRKQIHEDVYSDPDAVFDKLRDRAKHRDK